MKLLQGVALQLQRKDMLQALITVLVVLLFALAVSWPAVAEPNVSWETVAQVRSVALMLAATSFGIFSAAKDRRATRLETLLALFLFVPLVWPLEAAAYAASYPDVPLGWSTLQALLDLGSYFGIGLLLGIATRRVALLWTFLPLLLLAGLISLSMWTERPLLNPLATALHISWTHLGLSFGLTALTLALCIRSRLEANHEDRPL